MKHKLKVTIFCVFLIFLFGGCCKTVATNSKGNTGTKTFQGSSANKESTKNKNDNENNKKKVVVLDPGHGNNSSLEKEAIYPGAKELKIKNTCGAEGINSKTPEYVITLKIAGKLKKLLENKGYNVTMTKTTIQENPGNVERAEIGNKNNANLVIRIHADSSESSNVSGASMLVPAPIGYAKNISEISKKYGQIVLQNLTYEVGMKNRGIVERNDLTGFNWSKVPIILIETGFLSNPQEDKLLNSEEYQNKIAKGLFDGIDKTLNN